MLLMSPAGKSCSAASRTDSSFRLTSPTGRSRRADCSVHCEVVSEASTAAWINWRFPSRRQRSDGGRIDLESYRGRLIEFRVDQSLRQDIERIAEDEQRTITQVCEMLLHEGVEAYKKEGSKFMQRLVAKQKLRTK